MKHYVFDAFGTLFQVHLPSLTLPSRSRDRLLSTWRNEMLTRTWLTTLSGHWKPFEQILEESLLHAMAVAELEDKSIFDPLMDMYQKPTLHEDVDETLVWLKNAGHRLYILSNGSANMLNEAAKQNGLSTILDGIYSVEAARKYKIHPAAYQLVQDLSFTVHFVSSNTWDIFGANHFGFTTYWVNRQHQLYPYQGQLPDHILRSFRELIS